MKNLVDIKQRIKSVSDTRQITSAMETISVAKMRKAMTRYENNKLYFESIRETISDIALHSATVINKYLNATEGKGRAVFIVVASDKGLAGGFNLNVLNAAYKQMQNYPDSKVFTIGQIAREFFERKGIIPDIEFMGASYEPTMRDAIEIAESITTLYENDMMDEVFVVYTKMINSAIMTPDVIKLLPLNKSEVVFDRKPLKAEEEYLMQEIEYEPSADEVLASLIPQYLTGIIYGALVQSVASEQSSRRNAMNNATNNATEILDELKIEYNRARQEAVTNELSEIITSALGVK